MPISKTYTILKNTPPPMTKDEYYNTILDEWGKLLNSDEKYDEKVFQKLLELHPSMVPGAFELFSPSGHYPFPLALISQPPLLGLGSKVPDFLWFATNSQYLHPIFIEIETPYKKWFTKEGHQHHQLTQALGQLADWKTWISKPQNLSLFLEYYKIPDDIRRYRTIKPYYVLIYGRRSEFEDDPVLSQKRGQLARQDEVLMTFDRLTPNKDTFELMTVRITERGYNAITVPPTMYLGPNLAETRAIIDNKHEAITKNPYITQERKEFLLSRINYWDEWGRLGRKGIISTGDKE